MLDPQFVVLWFYGFVMVMAVGGAAAFLISDRYAKKHRKHH